MADPVQAAAGDSIRENGMDVYIGSGVDLFDVDPWSPPRKERVIGDAADIAGSVIRATGLSSIYADNYLDIKHKIALDFGLKGLRGF